MHIDVYIRFSALLLLLLTINGCNRSTENNTAIDSAFKTTAPIKVIFDTDMGSDCDDVGALALLHHYANEGKAQILGSIYSSGKVPYGAGVIDAINHYYERPDIPIGAAYDTHVGDPIDKMSAEKLAQDTTKYGHRIIHNTDTYEQTLLNRQLLSSQEDSSVVYITVGHTKGLYDLLVSEPDSISALTGIELVSRKVKHWVALGALNANNPDDQRSKDWNFFFNNTADYTDYLVKNFPRPIYFVSGGSNVMTGKSLVDTPEGNIVRQAYTDWLNWYGGKTLEDQRPSWDLVTVYFAVEGLGDYFKFEETGWLDFNPNAGCIWTTEPNNFQHYYVNQIENTDSLFADYLNELISYPPNTSIHE